MAIPRFYILLKVQIENWTNGKSDSNPLIIRVRIAFISKERKEQT